MIVHLIILRKCDRAVNLRQACNMSKCVDVVIPCYQYGHFLQDCVNSVLIQKDVQVKVLIIDDASSDNTLEIARNLAKRDSRVEVRRHLVNQGHINTYNE